MNPILFFLKHPFYRYSLPYMRSKVYCFSLSLLFIFLFIFVWNYIAGSFFHMLGYSSTLNMLTNEVDSKIIAKIQKFGWFTILAICLIGPVFEELTFRYFLNYKTTDIAVSLSSILFLSSSIWKFAYEPIYWGILITIAISTLPLFIYCLKRFDLTKKIKKHQKKTLWLTLLTFWLLHLNNFNIVNYSTIPFQLVLIIPIGVLGMMLSFIRINLGFGTTIIFHCVYNSIMIIPTIINFT